MVADAVPDAPSVSVAAFTEAMSTLAASVTIVAAAADGVRKGRTVTSMFSVSTDPPALLVSISKSSALAQTIIAANAFSLAVLAEDQKEIANVFAGRGGHTDRFVFGRWEAFGSGQPLLGDGVSAFDCVLAGTIEMDTHYLFAGRVRDLRASPERKPLVWHRRGYERLVRES